MPLISDPPPIEEKKTTQHKKKYGFTPTTNRKIKKGIPPPLPGRHKWISPNQYFSYNHDNNKFFFLFIYYRK